jgi:uncharacterized membrane protein/thiol-disulfide isomerase/thioredoxin
MKRWVGIITSLLVIIISSLPITSSAMAEEPVIRAVLFFSPTCGHCHKVITEDLPPLLEKYGQEQLQILGINVAVPEGQALYFAAVDQFNIPEDRIGVPTLIVADTVLVGGFEIPDQFPGIIETGIENGGIDWPAIPGLKELVEQADSEAQPESDTEPGTTVPTESDTAEIPEGEEIPEYVATETIEDTSEPTLEEASPTIVEDNDNDGTADVDAPEQSSPITKATPISEVAPDLIANDLEETFATNMSMSERFRQDPTGNTLSVIVLIGMVLSVVGVGYRFSRTIPQEQDSEWLHWIIPVISVIGMVIAGYLSYVEVTQTEAVCGPVGDCNTVQQSSYANIMGFLPVGIFGLMGYVVILVVWTLQYYGPEKWRGYSALSVWGLALFGTLFSIYLTFLEPFVIGATCAWCISSAIIMTVILWVATGPAKHVWDNY